MYTRRVTARLGKPEVHRWDKKKGVTSGKSFGLKWRRKLAWSHRTATESSQNQVADSSTTDRTLYPNFGIFHHLAEKKENFISPSTRTWKHSHLYLHIYTIYPSLHASSLPSLVVLLQRLSVWLLSVCLMTAFLMTWQKKISFQLAIRYGYNITLRLPICCSCYLQITS